MIVSNTTAETDVTSCLAWFHFDIGLIIAMINTVAQLRSRKTNILIKFLDMIQTPRYCRTKRIRKNT